MSHFVNVFVNWCFKGSNFNLKVKFGLFKLDRDQNYCFFCVLKVKIDQNFGFLSVKQVKICQKFGFLCFKGLNLSNFG